MRTTAKRLIPRCFDPNGQHNCVSSFCNAAKKDARKDFEDLIGELFYPQYFSRQGGSRPVFKKESQMAWKAPKIVEVPVGMEINMYMCATRK
jgi:coenzyme PQQ precursor peptide PqqA